MQQIQTSDYRDHRTGYLYIAFSERGVTKVGMSYRNAESRVSSAGSAFRFMGDMISGSIVSGEIVNPREAERRLIAFCAERGKAHPASKEFFTGISREEISDFFAKSFPSDSQDILEAALAARSEALCVQLEAIDKLNAKESIQQKDIDAYSVTQTTFLEVAAYLLERIPDELSRAEAISFISVKLTGVDILEGPPMEEVLRRKGI